MFVCPYVYYKHTHTHTHTRTHTYIHVYTYIYIYIQLAAMLANDGANVYSVDLNGIMLMKRGKVRDFVVA